MSVAAGLLRLEDRREYDAVGLSAAAADASAEVRRRAVLAAGRIGDKRATPLVVARLADADTSVAASAAFALGLLRDTTAAPALAQFLRSADVARRPSVIGEAALALGKMPTQGGKQAVEDFLAHAPASGPGVRRAVGEALLAFWRFPRPMNVNVATRWLSSADPEIRWRAAYALSRRPSPQGTAALARVATAAEPLVRSFAMRGLTAALADSAAIDRATALRLVMAGVGDANHAVSVNAVRTLGTYDAPESISRLVTMLGGGDAYLAITAAESLERLGAKAPSSADALRRVALDAAKPIALRTAALSALAAVDASSAATVADAFMRESGWRSRAAAARVYAGAAATAGFVSSPLRPKLEAAIRDPDGRVATAALEAAVGAAGDGAARIRPLLLAGLENPDFYARVNAINGLGAIADPADAPALLAAYDRAQRDSMDDAALAAVDALGALGRKDTGVARAFFARFGRSSDYLVRQHVVTAFGEDVPGGWGTPLPISTARSMDDYELLVRSGVVRPRRHARIVTNRGTIELELFGDDAPMTVDNFLTLARRGYFNGQDWPRVVANFVVQGGDPRGDTNGGPGYAIRDEINRHPYETGTLGMALSGPDTGGSQWFVTHSPQPHLDGTYTVFGRVVRGMDAAGRILPGDRIIRVEEVR
ncbi:peptidylprolyl isomerase [Longimicrobium sp.]|uniref:peptidylprolyl isomerase n=1 Tax=Longimicrobium sp. TaxID=2029185 RepID=UPI002C16975A|nr:peptidylprolyl isomerase [Longimicrobium sp.]HSU17595.1 peptidylprolyl isomerase [Longimicrobium sp.]